MDVAFCLSVDVLHLASSTSPPVMAISIVLEVPMTDLAVEIGILGLGRDWCRHKLWRPISVELTKWPKYKICYITTIAVKWVA